MVLVVGHVNAQSSYLTEGVSITIDCQQGTVDVSSSESYFPVNDTSPVHTPSGVNLTNMNPSDVKDVTLTFSTSNSTIAVWVLNTSASRSIGDAWATMLSTPFQTSFTYDYTSMFGDFVNYKASGKSSLSQYMQSLMSWCFVSNLNGFSPTLVQIAGEPGSYITVDMFPSSNNDWYFTVKCSYETSMSKGSGDHTVGVLNLLGVTSLTPSSYSGYYDSTYLTEVYLATVDVTITSSQTVTYASSQPAGLRTDMPPAGVLAPRGWSDVMGAGTSPVFNFENDSSPVNQLTYTFSGVVVPEFPSTMILSLFMVIFMLAAIVAIRRFPRKIKTQN
ncbi:MAG: hypothetical protein ABR962_06915 [Candidatus Bathyarchaeia archaeon]